MLTLLSQQYIHMELLIPNQQAHVFGTQGAPPVVVEEGGYEGHAAPVK
jgi:hypothetical protein